jgi:hypothetical protein
VNVRKRSTQRTPEIPFGFRHPAAERACVLDRARWQ